MDKRWTFFSADVELSSRCGATCRFCPRHQLTRKAGHMDLEKFRAVAPVLAKAHVRVTFCGMGNPTLNPDWTEFIKIYRGLGGFCGIVIRAADVTDAVLDGLMAAGPNVVEASFASVDPESFNRLCPDVSYANSLERMERLIELPNRCFAVVPVGVRTALNPDERAAAKAFWKRHGLEARVASLHSRGGHLADTTLGTFDSSGIQRPCGLFAIHAFVGWNGDLLSCCHDLSGSTVLGSLFDDDLETLMERKMSVLERVPHADLCNQCTDDYRLNPIPSRPFPLTRSARKKALRRLGSGQESATGRLEIFANGRELRDNANQHEGMIDGPA